MQKKGEAARIATAERQAVRRLAMVEAFHDKALELVAAIDPTDPATARFAVPACALADKAFLMAGLLKKSTDPAQLTATELQQMIEELESELGKVAPKDATAADRELERMHKEIEHRIRAEVMAEFDRELSNTEHPERVEIMREVVARTPAPNGHPVIEKPPDPPKPHNRRPPDEVGPTW